MSSIARTTVPSTRIVNTDDPIVAQMRRLVQSVEGTASLAQGIVYYPPPDAAMARVQAALADPATQKILNSYGADEGLLELRDKLREKLAKENGLHGVDVFVTHGAQQAFANVRTPCGSGDIVRTPQCFESHPASSNLYVSRCCFN